MDALLRAGRFALRLVRVVERGAYGLQAVGFKKEGWCELIRSEILNLFLSAVFLDLARHRTPQWSLCGLRYH